MVSTKKSDDKCNNAVAAGCEMNKASQRDLRKYYQEIYKIYEFDDGLYFPDMMFRCGSIDNYVKTGLLSDKEVEEIWNENATLR